MYKAKYIIIFFIILIKYEALFSQKEGNNWYFGTNAGLNFNTDPPTALTNGQLNTYEGCASISDKNGNLLLYTDGMTVYDKMHNVMPNGSGLLGHSSSTQSAIIVPKPGTYNPTLKRFDIYYIFTVDAHESNQNGIRYSIVDMTLNNGNGDITTKNVHLLGTATTEKICAVRHAIGCDYWIICIPVNSNNFYAYLLNSSGLVTSPVISITGPTFENKIGYMKVSPNGEYIAIAQCGGSNHGIFVYDFDKNTGVVSLKFSDTPILSGSSCNYGVEFSPNNKFLYLTTLSIKDIYQYNLDVSSNIDFKNSRTLIGTISNNYNYKIGTLQLASNNKIYVALENQSKLAVINNPNLQGIACNFVDMAQDLAGKKCQLGLPNFPNSYQFPPYSIIFNDSICINDTAIFSLSDNDYISIEWNFFNLNNPTNLYASSNDQTPAIVFNDPGKYIINAIIETPCQTDTIHDTITVISQIIDISAIDDTICKGQTTTLMVNGANSYLWSNGQSGSNISVSPMTTTTYSVTGVNNFGCPGVGSITIYVNYGFDISYTASPEICNQNNGNIILEIANGTPPFNYSWSTGSSDSLINNLSSGIYRVTVSDANGCVKTASITVDHHSTVFANFHYIPTNITIDNPIVSFINNSSGGTIFFWDFGDGNTSNEYSPNHTYAAIGTYTVMLIVSDDQNCIDTAIDIIEIKDFSTLYLPNVITPNDDGQNDVFHILATNIELDDYSIRIFNRWGNQLFYSTDVSKGWDAKYNGKLVPMGVYYYIIAYIDSQHHNRHVIQGEITVIY
jgi:gliding motility-associated-like protein